jgi:hypothetical protein
MLKTLGIWAAIGLAFYGLYLFMFPTYTFRYSLTVHVNVDGKIVSGTTVRELRRWRQVVTFGFPYGSSLDGEAAVVDLGKRGILFATLYGANISDTSGFMLPEWAFQRTLKLPQNYTASDGDQRVELWKQLSRLRACSDLILEEWPLLARFGDLTVPASVQSVDPNNLSASFGSGVSPNAIKICLVDDPPSRLVDKLLPWNRANGEPLVASPPMVGPKPLATTLRHLAFVRKPDSLR